MPYIPQELLYNISSYGRVIPWLTVEHIGQSVNNLDPNFNWAGEFLLEYYRANDEVYQQLLEILNRIPKSKYPELRSFKRSTGIVLLVPVYGLTSTQIREIAGIPYPRAGEVMIIRQSPTMPYITSSSQGAMNILSKMIPGVTYQQTLSGNVRAVISTVNLTDQEIEDYKNIATQLGLLVEVINNRSTSTDRRSAIQIPLAGQTDDTALYLASPRATMSTYNGIGQGNRYEYTVNIYPRGMQNYPEMLNRASKESLVRIAPQYFQEPITLGRLPTDLEIIQAILTINPEYNLGDLIQWLGMKRRICPEILGTDIYNLVRSRFLTTISALTTFTFNGEVSYIDVDIPLDSSNISDDIRQFLDNSGIKYVIHNVTPDPMISIRGDTVEREPNVYEVVQGLVDGFLASRVCMLNYLPTFNESKRRQ